MSTTFPTLARVSCRSFDANRTLNHSARHAIATLGPRGQWSGEGHYGLQLVGTAQVCKNCCVLYNTTT